MTGIPDERAVAVVLAAGRGSRFGGGKLLADLDGRPLVAHVVAAAAAAGLEALVVVPPGGAVESAARTAGAGTVVNPDPDAGLSTSLAVGLAALPPATAAAVVLLADQPTLDPATIRAVLAAHRAEPEVPWRARYADGSGHPVILPRSVWGLVGAVRGDVGARDVLPALRTREVTIDGPRPPDVDVPIDLEALRGHHPR